MKTIRIRNLILSFQAGQITHGPEKQQRVEALRLVNLALQREPYGMGAWLELKEIKPGKKFEKWHADGANVRDPIGRTIANCGNPSLAEQIVEEHNKNE